MMTDIVCAALMRSREILLVRRAAHKKRFPECWDLVGGHVEANERVSEALIREVQEEVGLTPTDFRLLEIVTEAGRGNDDQTRYHVYAVTGWSGGEAKLLGDEHTEIRWVPAAFYVSMFPLAHPEYAHQLVQNS